MAFSGPLIERIAKGCLPVTYRSKLYVQYPGVRKSKRNIAVYFAAPPHSRPSSLLRRTHLGARLILNSRYHVKIHTYTFFGVLGDTLRKDLARAKRPPLDSQIWGRCNPNTANEQIRSELRLPSIFWLCNHRLCRQLRGW